MGLMHFRDIPLPGHVGTGGFDHAAVTGRGLLYVAHTANDAVDVIDTRSGTYAYSIDGLKGVAGVLVDEPTGLVFTSNRGEDSVGVMSPNGDGVFRIAVGVRPNGLAYDPDRGTLLSANVGDPGMPVSPSVTVVDIRARAARATFAMPGRTRWTIFDPDQHLFFVNIAEPPEIVVIEGHQPERLTRRIAIPAKGPHGLDLDPVRQRLYCACDEGRVVSLDARSGAVLGSLELSGAPDVVFLNAALDRLYVAIGDPGVIDVIDVDGWKRAETIPTERGAHTLAFDASTNSVYAFLPRTHRASVYQDVA